MAVYEPAHGSRMPGIGPGDGDGLEQRSTPELMKEFVSEAQVLLKEELRLAKAEAKEEARKAAKAGVGFGAGAAFGYAGLLLFGAFLVALGSLFMPVWLSALIVAVVYFAIAGIAALYGKKQLDNLEPARPVHGIKEEREWLSDTMRNVRSSRHGHA